MMKRPHGTAPSLYWGSGLNLCNCDGTTTQLDSHATVVVSEPLDAEEFAWHEVPECSLMRVADDGVEIQPLEL